MTETPFRIGGYYRDKSGDIVQLTPDGRARWMDEQGDWDMHGGIFCLATGECSSAAGYRYFSSDLQPGELHQINGEWVPRGVPVEDKPAVVDQCDGYTVEVTAEAINWIPNATTQTAPTKERTLPALTWADSKPFDNFKGYEVTSRGAYRYEEEVWEAPQGPLQRIAQEGDQLHGSAWLRKGA